MLKRILATIVFLVLMAIMTLTASAMTFADVTATDWFADAVYTSVDLGLINGKGKDSSGADYFDPDGYITLSEAVKLAACIRQLYTEGRVTLTNGNPWYETYADYGRSHFLMASEAGFSYESVMANPGIVLKRAEFAWIFARALPSEALPEINSIPDNAIPDVQRDEQDCLMKYYTEIYTLYRAGIVNGSDKNGSFLPASNIKRSEVAAIVVRMINPEKRVGPPANLGAAPIVDFTLEDLIEQNSITNLMKRHSCVTIRDAGAKKSDEGKSYWVVDDFIVYTDVWYYGDERHEMGAYGSFAYSVKPQGQITAKLWVSPSDNRSDNAISSAFPNKLTEDIKILAYDAETLTVQLTGEAWAGENITAPAEMKAVINRENHELLSYSSTIVYSVGNIYYAEKQLEYDSPAVGASVMTGWDKTRIISIETEPYVWGTYPTELTCPVYWDLTIAAHPQFGVKISVSGVQADDLGEFHVSAGEEPISVAVHS